MSRRSFFILLIAMMSAGLLVYGFFLLRGTHRASSVQPSFVERRNDVAVLLQELSAVPDADLSRLSDIDRRRDWKAGFQLMADVIGKHAEIVTLVEDLVGKTSDLIVETQRINDRALREQALAAMVHLSSGNDALLSYFRLRSQLFRTLQQYYASRMTGTSLTAPVIADDFAAIDEAVGNASASYALFRDAIERFDRVARLRYQGALLFLS